MYGSDRVLKNVVRTRLIKASCTKEPHNRLLKKVVSKAAAESQPEAYP